MIVGEPSEAALEFHPRQPGFLSAVFWLAGLCFGDPMVSAPSGVLAEGLERFQANEARRFAPRLFHEETSALLDRVENALFGEADSLEEARLQGREHSAFLLSPNLFESLDDCFVVVVSGEDFQRVAVRRSADGALFSSSLPLGTMERLCESTVRQIRAVERH